MKVSIVDLAKLANSMKYWNHTPLTLYPVGKIAKKQSVRVYFLTTWHCILSVELKKNALIQFVCLFGDYAHWVIAERKLINSSQYVIA